ncbi:hypothetical protein [Nephila clavipes virus 4]|uniref:hypothetical protein n=1 Tax=Nephila clavipes virus 4 TaxID=2108201 RepID=UPI000D2036B3|nr:hypothetical protein [Nephila clavipes virus 4]AVK59481.1 hypothetical protein [Nephila clavipes virus 4]
MAATIFAFIYLVLCIHCVFAPPCVPCHKDECHTIYKQICRTGDSRPVLVHPPSFRTRISYVYPVVLNSGLISPFNNPSNVDSFLINIVDFHSSCNYYSDIGCVNTTLCNNMRAYSVLNFTVCLSVKKTVTLEVYHVLMYYILDVARNHSFSLPDHPTNVFDIDDNNCIFISKNGSRQLECKNFAFHHFYDNLIFSFYVPSEIRYSCGFGSGFFYTVNIFPPRPKCIFTYKFLGSFVCAASYGRFCGDINSSIFVDSFINISFKGTEVPFNDTCNLSDFRLFSIYQNFFSDVSYPEFSRNIRLIGGDFFSNFTKNFLDFSGNVSNELVDISRAFLLLSKNFNTSFSGLMNFSFPSLNCTVPNVTVSIPPIVVDFSTFKCPVLKIDRCPKPDIVLRPVLNSCRNISFVCPSCPKLVTDFSKFPKPPVPILNPVLNNCSCPSFPDNLTLVPDIEKFVEMSGKILHHLLGFVLSGEEGHLLKSVNYTLSPRIKRSIGTWFADAVFSLCRPFFKFFLSIFSEILMAFVTFLLDFEPYLDKFLIVLETKLEELVDMFVRLTLSLIKVISRFLFHLELQIHLFEFVFLFTLFYFFNRDRLLSLIFTMCVMYFVGLNRLFPSFFLVYEKDMANFSAILATVLSGQNISLVNGTFYFGDTILLTVPIRNFSYLSYFDSVSFNFTLPNVSADYYLKLSPHYDSTLQAKRNFLTKN